MLSGWSVMNCRASLTASGGDAVATCWRKPVISSLALVPFTCSSLRCDASPFTSAVLPGCANTGCSVKLGNTIMSVISRSHCVS